MVGFAQQPIFLVFGATFGLGIFLLVSGPIVGRRRPDLVTRLRRLDPDAWVAEDQVWAEGILGSLSEDLARAVGRVVGRIGLIAPHELSRTLMQADLGLSA